MIAMPKMKEMRTRTGPSTTESTWRKMMRASLSPETRAASMKSSSRIPTTVLRVSRNKSGEANTPSVIMVGASPLPSELITTMMIRISGSDISMFENQLARPSNQRE